MIFDENDQEQRDYLKPYNENYFAGNNNLFYEKSENFQESFMQTFNEHLYNQKFQLQEQPNLAENFESSKFLGNGTNHNQNDSFSTFSSSKSTHQHESEEPIESLKYMDYKAENTPSNQLGGKRGRPMADRCLIIDEITNKVYDPEVDADEYRKARKRIQNRESAIRSRIKKKECNKQFEAEMDYLRKENYRLNFENNSLKRERVFLFDQVKFLQGLLKKDSHNCITKTVIKQKDENIITEPIQVDKDVSRQITNDIENNTVERKPVTNSKPVFGTYKKPPNKLFLIGVFCIISLVYVSVNNPSETSSITFSNDYTVSMKESATEASNKGSVYYIRIIVGFASIMFLLVLFIQFSSYFVKKIQYFKMKILKIS
jgi:hypothetical protein